MHTNNKVILVNLTLEDSGFLHKIYTNPKLTVNFDDDPSLKKETPEEFAKRIISSCEYIFTIRPSEKPELIIGDCALHDFDKQEKEVFIGGSLLPEYWGKGYMQAAFELLMKIAKEELGVSAIYGQTKTRNSKAIRFAEKMGFVKHKVDKQDLILRMDI